MHTRFGMILALMVLAACTALAACTGFHPKGSHARPSGSGEIFDEQTGNTLSMAAAPLVFARPRTDVAANERDYATLVAVEIDQSGKFNDYLLLYRWSTVDRRMSPPPDPNAGELRILAEGRVIDLMPLDQVPISLSRRRDLHVPEHGDVVAHAYPIDVTTLRYIALSRELTVHMPQESLDTPFGLWEDGRKALGRFLQRAGAH
jgi:hypothetical protein